MRSLWSEYTRRVTWRRVWMAVVDTLAEISIVPQAQADDLRPYVEDFDVEASLRRGKQIGNDFVADLKIFATQASVGGRALSWINTYDDIELNAFVLSQRDALDLLIGYLRSLLESLAVSITKWAHIPTLSFSHLQPAEPMTVGFRLAIYGQDLLTDFEQLLALRATLRGKGLRGDTGTAAEYVQLLRPYNITPAMFEQVVMRRLGLEVYAVSTPTILQKQDERIAAVLSSIAGNFHKFATDIRHLQSTLVGEWMPPGAEGEADMLMAPYRSYSVVSEHINALGRFAQIQAMLIADSANQGVLESHPDETIIHGEVFPMLFLAVDEMLILTGRLVHDLKLDLPAIQFNMERFGAFAPLDRLLVALVQAGAERTPMRNKLRQYAFVTWNTLADGAPNSLIEDVSADSEIRAYLSGEQIRALLNYSDYLGDAPQRAIEMGNTIRSVIRT